MRSSFSEDIFENSPAVILCDNMLEVFLRKGCIGTKDGIGSGLGKCPVHDDVSLAGFVMGEFSHRRYQKVNKVFGCINMVEVRENRVLLFDGGCDFQSNLIINDFRASVCCT